MYAKLRSVDAIGREAWVPALRATSAIVTGHGDLCGADAVPNEPA